MEIMPEDARSQIITAAINASDEKAERMSIPWKDSQQLCTVVKINIDAVVLNARSHRIRAQLESLEASDQLRVRDDPFSSKAQEIIADILRHTDGYKDLKTNLVEEGQRDAGIVTRKGLLVNANTRVVALREVGQKWIRVAVLPADGGEPEIADLELRLQMKKELRQEYTFTNELLFVDELLTLHHYTPEKVALSLRWAASREKRELAKGKDKVDQATRMLVTIRQLQDMSDKRIPLTFFDDGRQEALRALDEWYEGTKLTDPGAAERGRVTRLCGLIVNAGFRNMRVIDGDFAEEFLKPSFESDDLLQKHLSILSPEASGGGGDEIPGLDLLVDEPNGKGSTTSAQKLLSKLTKSFREPKVMLPTMCGVSEVDGEDFVQRVHDAIEAACLEAKDDRSTEGDLFAPIKLLREARKKIDRAIARAEALGQNKKFCRGDFLYEAKRLKKLVDQLIDLKKSV